MRVRDVFKEKEFIFIAEIGINHRGDFDIACQMVNAAAHAGASAVKFQTFVPEKMFSSFGKSLLENSTTPYKDFTQINFFKNFTLRKDEYIRISEISKQKGIIFFSSVFDDESLKLLEDINVPLYKIASSEVTNIPLLKLVGKTKKPVILSTGICTENEIATAIDVLRTNGTPDIVLLHCVSLYPLPPEKVNLKRIESLQKRFNIEVGFSDHSADFAAVEAAVVMGAKIFEKHFTLSSDFDCPDAAVSLSPEQFHAMCQSCLRISQMLGNGTIDYDSSQKEVARSARKSLYARRRIPSGKIIDLDDIAIKRPGVGLSPHHLNDIIGLRAKIDIEEDYILKLDFFK
ncbi:MAG: N-acetylneuraminate synthase family protein [Spirochaetes bacterium]|nr:N-acetylneuraminate synthase family protein [Spirochaetota bacterium]